MQKRSLTASWESQLRSYESELSPDRPRSPKHAHLPQSSSPSFLEAYAKYVEQQRESDLSRDSSGSSQRQSQGIRAFSGSQTARSDDKASPPDARRDTSDSGYSSWPASASTGSPVRPVHLARPPGQSAESLPSPSSYSPSRFRRSIDVQRGEDGSTSLRKQQLAARVSVAAAVDALESRCRSPSPEPASSVRGHPLLTIPLTSSQELADSASAPSSPWPDVAYQPDSPRHRYTVEVCVVPSDGATAVARTPAVDTGSSAQAAAFWEAKGDAGRECSARLAQALDERPDLQERLARLLEEQQFDDEHALADKVQELLKDHPDVVASLNKLFDKGGTQPVGLREALLSTASVRAFRGEEAELQSRHADILEKRRKYMVVMRGLNTADVSGLRCQLEQRGIPVRSWDDFGKWLVPPADKRYLPWCTFVIIAGVICIFFFMAGGYGTFLQQTGQGEEVEEPSTPSELRKWLQFSPAWRTFDFAYLLLWGGQYLPAINDGQAWRWITAAFLHVTFQHLLANMLLFAVLGGLLERHYGSVRVLVVLVLSTFGAAFFAGAFEVECTLVVGSSGAVLGFVGLTVADLVVNHDDLFHALMRLVIIIASATFFIVTAVTKANQYTSNWSHLGGFVCGLFPSFLFLPNFKDRRWRKAEKLAAKLGIMRRPEQSGQKPGGQRRAVEVAARAGNDSAAEETAAAEDRHHLETPGGGARAAAADQDESEQVPPELLAPRPMHSLATWLDGPSQDLEEAAGTQEARRPTGGIPLPGLAQASKDSITVAPGERGDILTGNGEEEERSPEEPSPNGSEPRYSQRLFTERRHDREAVTNREANVEYSRHRFDGMQESSSGCYLGAALPRICARTRLTSVKEGIQRLRSRCGSWRLLFMAVGAFVIVGVFVSLPTYIYVVRLPNTHCPA